MNKINNLYKKMIVVCIFVLLTSTTFAQNAKRVVVLPSTAKGLSGTEEYFISLVHDKLEANLREYTPFTVVDMTNESEIRKLQAKSEGDAFDADTAIELQRLTSANNAVFSTIIRTRRGFILTLSLTDLTTGVKKAATAPISRDYGEDLFDGKGCGVDEATIQFCKQLSIKLTARQIASLTSSEKVDEPAEVATEEDDTIIPEDERGCIRAGYKMFTFGRSAEDNIVIPNKNGPTYEVDIYAVHKKRGFKHFGSITVLAGKGYKKNPLDKDLDQYSAIYMKVTNNKRAVIMNMGDKHGDQYFEIQQQ